MLSLNLYTLYIYPRGRPTVLKFYFGKVKIPQCLFLMQETSNRFSTELYVLSNFFPWYNTITNDNLLLNEKPQNSPYILGTPPFLKGTTEILKICKKLGWGLTIFHFYCRMYFFYRVLKFKRVSCGRHDLDNKA